MSITAKKSNDRRAVQPLDALFPWACFWNDAKLISAKVLVFLNQAEKREKGCIDRSLKFCLPWGMTNVARISERHFEKKVDTSAGIMEWRYWCLFDWEQIGVGKVKHPRQDTQVIKSWLVRRIKQKELDWMVWNIVHWLGVKLVRRLQIRAFYSWNQWWWSMCVLERGMGAQCHSARWLEKTLDPKHNPALSSHTTDRWCASALWQLHDYCTLW